jgi:hypothetical protein
MRWAGAEDAFLDRPAADAAGRMVLGRYGGRVEAGARKNEDAALLLEGADWEFAIVADAHAGGDSSALAVQLFDASSSLRTSMERPVAQALTSVRALVVEHLQGADTSRLTGESAVLAVARKGQFLLWLSVGDCVAHALHPELARLGQYALNRRSFFEWFGRVDSLRLDMPCYASGVHALRPGRTRIALVTDGLLEFGAREYGNGARLHAELHEGDLRDRVLRLMHAVHEGRGVDSATVVAWDVTADATTIQPSG